MSVVCGQSRDISGLTRMSDCAIAKLFYNLCLATQANSTQLTKDSLLLDFLSRLIALGQLPDKYSSRSQCIAQSSSSIKSEVSQVCDYLQAQYSENVSLAELANLVGIRRAFINYPTSYCLLIIAN